MFKNRCFEEEQKEYGYMMGECAPIYEQPCERVCHREIPHQVKHIQPVNTRIINHHIYYHSYEPCYTCCEENEICNIYGQNPCCKR